MIGLIKLTLPNGDPFYINPGMITMFTTNTKETADILGLNAARSMEKGSIMFIAGQCFQLMETPNQVINSITRLRQKAEDNALQLRKKAEKEDWEDYDDEDED